MTVHWVFDDADSLLTMTACPHTVYGDQTQLIAGRFPMANLFHYFKNNWWNREDHAWQHSSVADRPHRYAYNIGTWNDASYWTGWPGNDHGFDNFMRYVPQPVLYDAQQGRALLVIDNLNEGFYDPRLYEFLHQCCAEFDIPAKTLCFMTNNQLDPRGYAAWCDTRGVADRITVIGMPHLMYMQQLNLRNSVPLTWADHSAAKARSRSIANYNCLNRISRNHRELLVMNLIDRDLHTQGMVSHNALAYHGWTEHGVPQAVIDRAHAVLPLIVDDADFGHNKAMHINTDIYLRSWCSVITETHAFDQAHNLFVSEKLWKPMFACQPFMVWGQQGTLSLLRAWGYETFGMLWDEHYDDLPDLERMHVLLDNIQSLLRVRHKPSWLRQAREVCEHNQAHFMRQDWFNSVYYRQFMAAYQGLNS